MKHPTMEDVAREAGVSRALVSLVFRASPRVAEASRQRVLAAAGRLGYRPNAMARGLASRSGGVVGVAIKDLHNPFFAETVDGIEDLAEREGVRLLLGHSGPQRREADVLDALLEYRPAGVILLSPDSRSADIAAQAGATPVVVVGRPVRQPGMDSIFNDDVRGAGLAVEHLAALGHERIAHVSGGPRGAGSEQRQRGYERVMRSRGLVAHVRVVSGGFAEHDGVEAAARLLAEGLPTAVVAANDVVAVGLMSGLEERGVRVPGDVSLVGYDNSSLARLRHVALTTIDQPRRTMGALALATLLERIRDGRTAGMRHRTEPTLVVRSTTAPPP